MSRSMDRVNKCADTVIPIGDPSDLGDIRGNLRRLNGKVVGSGSVNLVMNRNKNNPEFKGMSGDIDRVSKKDDSQNLIGGSACKGGKSVTRPSMMGSAVDSMDYNTGNGTDLGIEEYRGGVRNKIDRSNDDLKNFDVQMVSAGVLRPDLTMSGLVSNDRDPIHVLNKDVRQSMADHIGDGLDLKLDERSNGGVVTACQPMCEDLVSSSMNLGQNAVNLGSEGSQNYYSATDKSNTEKVNVTGEMTGAENKFNDEKAHIPIGDHGFRSYYNKLYQFLLQGSASVNLA